MKNTAADRSTHGLPGLARTCTMTSIPAEFYALANAFLFALHNMFTKKALRYSNPATAVISSLLINIIFLWGVSILLVPLASLTSAGILIFVGGAGARRSATPTAHPTPSGPSGSR